MKTFFKKVIPALFILGVLFAFHPNVSHADVDVNYKPTKSEVIPESRSSEARYPDSGSRRPYRYAPPVAPSENIPLEIERKFLLDASQVMKHIAEQRETYNIIQTYISYEPEVRVRQINGNFYTFTMKLPKDEIGLSRSELEFAISGTVYQDLVKKQVGNTIFKTRYQFKENGYDISVDIYSGDLTDLAVAEIEFDSIEESESFQPLAWFGADITSDSRYKNANLAKNGDPGALPKKLKSGHYPYR